MIDSNDLVPHMRGVLATERDLRDLAVIWQMIESSAEISCPEAIAPMLPTLIDTRTRFDRLQRELIEQMASENTAQCADDLRAKAQCAIDILVRNLYERTADVGFLAIDESVAAFCASSAGERAAGRAAMQRRLAEYQAKYTVYDDIVLLSPQGAVLARLDERDGLVASVDPVLAEALASRGWVERFAPGDLAADGRPALLYAHRVDAAGGRPAGVLVLRFRFADEMQRIFDGVIDDPHRVVMVLVDADRQVIASSDDSHIAIGARLSELPSATLAATSFAGREYLAVCCASGGYQGYAGPRWRAVAMVSLLTAFRRVEGAGDGDVPLDNPGLLAVQNDADTLQRELRRVLWNGGVTSGDKGADRVRLKSVLRQVALTAGRTRSRVGEAIARIHRVSLARGRHQAHELARMAADVMDRNLYERANDCRWWALSPIVQRVLAEAPSAAGSAALQAVLGRINALYTVYSQLVGFDHRGVIRAVSQAADAARWVGQPVPADWLQRLKGLSSAQRYAVTPFEPTALHAHGPTYTFLAAVRDAGGQRIVGGIAVVFNAEREFAAMLRDMLGSQAGFAAFVDGAGRVIAATDAALAGSPALRFVGDGAVIAHGNAHYACARLRARGYREFKCEDGYDNGVSAVVGLRLGSAERRSQSLSDVELAVPVPAVRGGGLLELAVFQVGAARYALPTDVVVEAIAPQRLLRTPAAAGSASVGMVEVDAGDGAGLVTVFCARQLFGVAYPARRTDGVILALRPRQAGAPPFALRVDDVLTVLEVDPRRVHAAPPGGGAFAAWLDGMVDCVARGAAGETAVLVQILSHQRLAQSLVPGPTTAVPRAGAAPLPSGRRAQAAAADVAGSTAG